MPTTPAPDHARPVPFAGRRLELVEAAVQLVAEAGLRGLTHRGVDAAAGLPVGSCSSYFRTRLALLTAVVDHVDSVVTPEVLELGERVAARGADPAANAADISELVVRRVRQPELMLALAELTLEAIRQPEIAEVVSRWRAGLVDIAARCIPDDVEAAEARLRAATVVPALEGILVAAYGVPEDAREVHVRRSVTLLVESMAASKGQVTV